MAYGDVKKKISEEKQSFDEISLMCKAHGCTLRWSVGPANLCSYHAWEDTNKWPSITESLNRDGPWELSRQPEIDTKSYPGHPKAWAMRLKDRHEAGDRLSRIQISMYRDALRLDAVTPA